MDILVKLLDFFEPHAIYEQISVAAQFYMTWAMPIFFVLSLAARYLEANTAILGDGTSMAEVAKDVLKVIMWTAVYAVFGILVLRLEVYLCALFYQHGSLSLVLEHYKELLEAANLVGQDGSFLDDGVNVLNFGTKAAAWILFYLSFLLMVFMYIFLRIAYAISFALLYLWGLVAIPTMQSKLLNISSGWIQGLIALFIWPLIEATVLMLIIPIFAAWGDKFVPSGAYHQQISLAGLYLLFFFCNLILTAASVASAFMAIKVASNQNMMSGIVAPFAVAAVGGFNMWKNTTSKIAQTVGGPITQRGSQAAGLINKAGGKALSGSAVKAASGVLNMASQGISSIKNNAGPDGDLSGTASLGKSENVTANNSPNSKGPGEK